MDEGTSNVEPGGQPQGAAPQGSVVSMGDGWAAGVHPVAVSPHSRRFRWGVAGAIVAIVALATTAGAFVLSGAAGAKSLTAGIAPKNSVYFMEVRTDLPGDQRAKLADFMTRFPGWQDRAQFDNALDELLNMLISKVSPDLRYTSAFKPWMEGEVSIAVADLGAVSASGSPMCNEPSIDPNVKGTPDGLSLVRMPSAVAIFALTDRSAAETWVSGELSRLNIKTAAEDYAGAKLYTTATGSGSVTGAYAFTDQDLLLGTVGGVKAALDTRTGGSLADNADYQAAMKSLPGDSLARFYVDARTLVQQGFESYGSVMCGVFGAQGATPPPAFDTGAMPAWLAGSIRAESDQMVLEVAMPRAGTMNLGNHTSRIASSLPGNTVGVLEIHSLGSVVDSGISALESQTPMVGLDAGAIKSVKTALSLVGGIDWLGDGSAVVTKDGSTFDGGIVAEAPDAATAQSKVDLVAGLVTLSSGATGFKSHGETYKGHAITVVSIPGGAGYGPFELAIGAKDNLIVAGYTDAFVKAVFDTTPSSSLASEADYSAAMGAAGSSNEGSAYINVPALEDQIGRAAFSSDQSRWTLNYKPYFDHVGGIACAVIDGNTVILRLVVTAR